jgi:two-component system sensor histidine kinase KdpD
VDDGHVTDTDEPLARRAANTDEPLARRAADTDQPLARAAAPSKTKRGELRIYLGAAPGVGKTYAMLGEAHRRLERGTDLVAAVVETHGRKKTADLIECNEIVPPHYV